MIGKRKRRTEIDGLFDHLAFIYSEKGSHLAQKKLPHDKHDKKSIQVKHSEDMRWSLYNKLHNDKQIVQKSQQRDNDQVHQRTKKNEEGTTSHERVNDIEDVPDIGFKHKKIHHKMVNKKTAKKKTTIQAGRPRNMLPIAASNESHFHDPNQESEESSENIKGHQLNEDSQQNFSKVKTYKKQKFKQTTNTTNEILERKMENKENDKVCSEQIQSKLRQDEVGNYCSNLQKNLFKSSLNEALPNEVTHLDVKVDFSINDKCNFFYDKLKINEFGHQENTNVQHKHSHKKRKGQYKDGIKLDLTLLSQKTPKRACSIKNTLSNNSNPAVGSTAGTCKSQPNIKDREHIFLKDKSSNIKRNTIDVSYHENKIKIGDLVTGKLRGYDWWFGMVVSHRTARQRPAAKDCYWIRWFGDHKISEVHVQNIESLKSFSTRYLPSKMQGLYLRSVKELLDEAAKRCSKTDLPEDSSKRLDVLIDWAKSGFQPFGVELLAQCSEDDNLSSDDSENEDLKHHDGDPLPSPTLAEDIKALFDKAAGGTININEICLACGDLKCIIEHPLFEGGLCKECKESFIETAYLYDEDGSQMYCSICSDGREIILCDVPGCYRSYCSVCLDMFCGVGYARAISTSFDWHCFMCTGEKVRLIRRRDDWQQRLKNIFTINNEEYQLPFFYDPVPFQDRPPLRVLSLFDGLSTGYMALSELGLDILIYRASEIDSQAIKVSQVHHNMKIEQIGDVQKITKQDIEKWGPFDLVIGGSPCDELSIVNPLRRGIYEGTGQLFFEFYRILEYCKPYPLAARPFFWLFENVVGMRYTDRAVISRFLQCHPVIVNAKEISAQQRTRYFWGNLPGMNRAMCPLPNDRLKLQQCLEKNCGRVAKFDKVRCITTSAGSLKQTKAAMLPVKWTISRNSQLDDGLWLTEIERIFGFPEHYTDVANMGQRDRLKLLGKSWSVPVVRHILAPLRNYFKSKVSTDNDTLSSQARESELN